MCITDIRRYKNNHWLPRGEYSHEMIQPHVPRAHPVNSVKLEPSGGPGGAGVGDRGANEGEVQLAESVLGQDAEERKIEV